MYSKIIFWKKELKALHNCKINYKNNLIGWINLLFIFPIFFSWFWVLGTFSGALPLINSVDTHSLASFYFSNNNKLLSSEQLSVFSSLFLIGNIFTVIPVALLVDRFSIKRVINFFLILGIIGIVGLILSKHNYQVACLFALIYGFSGGVAVVPFLKIAFQWFKPKNIALPISIYVGFGLLGGILLNLCLVPLSKVKFSNNYIFGPASSLTNNSGGFPLLICIMLLIIAFIMSLMIIEKKILIKKYYIGLAHYGSNFIKTLGKFQNISVPLIIGFMNLPVSVIVWSLHAEIFNYYNVPISSTNGNQIISVLLIGNFFGSFFMGYLADIIGKRKPLLIINNILLIFFTFLLLIKSLNITLLYLIFFTVGFFCSAQNIGYSMLTEQNIPDLASCENSINSITLLGVGAIIQNLFTKIQSIQINAQIPTYLLAMIPIIMCIPLLLSFFIVETGPKCKQKSRIERLKISYDYNWLKIPYLFKTKKIK